jgi:hypothetical protein
MAKLRIDSVSGTCEFEGTPQELLIIYDGLKQRLGNTIQIGNAVPSRYDVPRKAVVGRINFGLPADYSELAQKMPTVEQLVLYILGKPRFQHDVIDIELSFFKKQVNSRKYGRLYRELRTKLELARKAIEVREHGAFERRSAHPRNLQVYTFKPITSVLTQPESQKPS